MKEIKDTYGGALFDSNKIKRNRKITKDRGSYASSDSRGKTNMLNSSKLSSKISKHKMSNSHSSSSPSSSSSEFNSGKKATKKLN